MKHAIPFIIVLAAAHAAAADTLTHTVDFSHGFDGEIVTFQKFDTLGGTRKLTGMSLSYEQSIQIDYHVESNGYTAVASGDWFLDIAYNSIHQFGLIDNDPNPPFIGPGAAYQGGITGDIGISDGYNGSGPDTLFGSVDTGVFTFDASWDRSDAFGRDMLETFTGSGDIDTYFSGFSEMFGGWINDPGWVVDPSNPPDGPFNPWEDPYYGFFVTLDSLVQSGTITVTYEYMVPAPGTMTLAGLTLLSTSRRRRR